MRIPNFCWRSAAISACGQYRYELWRSWGVGLPTLYVGMLNPSKADASVDDPTIRKLFGFSVRLGFGAFCVWNLYAARATYPSDLWRFEDPVGPDNDEVIRRILDTVSKDPTGRLVLAWGAHARPDRVSFVMDIIEDVGITPFCWGSTAKGEPRHPLMLAYDTPLEAVRGARS